MAVLFPTLNCGRHPNGNSKKKKGNSVVLFKKIMKLCQGKTHDFKNILMIHKNLKIINLSFMLLNPV